MNGRLERALDHCDGLDEVLAVHRRRLLVLNAVEEAYWDLGDVVEAL